MHDARHRSGSPAEFAARPSAISTSARRSSATGPSARPALAAPARSSGRPPRRRGARWRRSRPGGTSRPPCGGRLRRAPSTKWRASSPARSSSSAGRQRLQHLSRPPGETGPAAEAELCQQHVPDEGVDERVPVDVVGIVLHEAGGERLLHRHQHLVVVVLAQHAGHDVEVEGRTDDAGRPQRVAGGARTGTRAGGRRRP